MISWTALFLIVSSACAQACYNFLVKQSSDKEHFQLLMFSVALGTLTVTGALSEILTLTPTLPLVVCAAGAALFYFGYQRFLGRAYAQSDGDLSLIYPLSSTGTLYVPCWAYLFLSERVSAGSLCGIALTVVGIFFLSRQQKKSTVIATDAIRYALIAAFFYSIGAIVEKYGVVVSDAATFTYWVMFFMWAYFLSWRKFKVRSDITVTCARDSIVSVAVAAISLTASFFLYRIALQEVPVSLAMGVRQVSAPCGVLIGCLVLRESYGVKRFLATMIIVLGIVATKVFS
jgi:uncharacterized membrane protein